MKKETLQVNISNQTFKSIAECSTLLIIPFIYLLVQTRTWHRLFFAEDLYFNPDPDYAYLLNGLLIRSGGTPWHTDHPGTSLQVLNMALAEALHLSNALGTSSLSLKESVVLLPQTHLAVIAGTFLVLQVVGIATLGFQLNKYKPVALSVVPQAAFLGLALNFSPYLLRNTPEGLIFTALIWVLVLVTPYLFGNKNKTARISDSRYIFASILLGIAAAAKINAWIVVALLPLAIARGRRLLFSYLIILAAAALFMIPALLKLPQGIRVWLSKEGTARSVFSGVGDWFILTILSSQWQLLGIFFLLALLVAIAWMAKLWRSPRISLDSCKNLAPQFLFLAVSLLIIFSSLVLALSRKSYWFVPAIPVLALAIAVTLSLLRAAASRQETRMLVTLAAISLSSYCVLAAVPPMRDTVGSLMEPFSEPWAVAGNEHPMAPPDSIVVSRTFSDKCDALMFGDAFAVNVAREEVAAECPGHRFAYTASPEQFEPYGATEAAVRQTPEIDCSQFVKYLSAGKSIFLEGLPNSVAPSFLQRERVAAPPGEVGEWSRVTSVDCSLEIESPGRNMSETLWAQLLTTELGRRFIAVWPFRYAPPEWGLTGTGA